MHRRLKLLTALAAAAGTFCGSAAAAQWTRSDWEKAEALRQIKCSKCHRLYDPRDYDEKTWEEWMVKMKKKSRMKNDDFQLVKAYMDALRKNERFTFTDKNDDPDDSDGNKPRKSRRPVGPLGL